MRSYLPDAPGTAAAIRADLLAVGIDAQLVEMESNEFLDKVYAGELDLFLLGWGAGYPHPLNFLGAILCAGDLAFGAPDAALCDQLDAAQAAPDLAGELAAYRAASRPVVLTPTKPLTVVIDYGALDLGEIDETTLALYYWDGVAWSSDGVTLVARDLAAHRLTVRIAHFSQFALWGQSTHWLFTPYAAR